MQAERWNSAAELILQRRWRELKQCQRQAEADECLMANVVLSPQPGSLPLVGDLSLTELADFVPSEVGIVGQFEQALHQFAVMSFRWAVRNLMAAAQTEDTGLRDTYRQLAHWYADRSAKLTRELQELRRHTTNPQVEVGSAAKEVGISSAPFNETVGLGEMSALAAMNVFVAATGTATEIEADKTQLFSQSEFDDEEPLPEPYPSAILPSRRPKW